MKRKRPNKDRYYLEIADSIAKRATCLRMQTGAVIVNNDQIISSGYVGAPRGVPNCCDLEECYRNKKKIPHGHHYEKCRSVHAEANAIIHAPRELMIGSTLYMVGRNLRVKGDPIVPIFPCMMCKRFVINAGIKRVVTMNAEGKIFEKDVKEWIEEAKEHPYKEIEEPDYNWELE
ncbi:MAG: dCMP deaminase family protein [Candidatus Woesearchaeota archaeon]|nr:MAG: dCMP deaminase family protein [Candidatus Woesearchaeota archaeon]